VFRGCTGDSGPICVCGCIFSVTAVANCATVKVAPSIATSFFTYELVKEYLVPP
jgi:hypothetical protein